MNLYKLLPRDWIDFLNLPDDFFIELDTKRNRDDKAQRPKITQSQADEQRRQ